MADPQKIMSGTASCADLMKCMLNLGDLEMGILKSLMRKVPLKSEDLAKEHKKDKSIIHRAVQRLMTCGLVIREKHNISQGGYYFVYTALPKEMIRKRMLDCVEGMYKNMRTLVDDFELDPKKKKR
jgi:predicted transcriptional regulator